MLKKCFLQWENWIQWHPSLLAKLVYTSVCSWSLVVCCCRVSKIWQGKIVTHFSPWSVVADPVTVTALRLPASCGIYQCLVSITMNHMFHQYLSACLPMYIYIYIYISFNHQWYIPPWWYIQHTWIIYIMLNSMLYHHWLSPFYSDIFRWKVPGPYHVPCQHVFFVKSVFIGRLNLHDLAHESFHCHCWLNCYLPQWYLMMPMQCWLSQAFPMMIVAYILLYIQLQRI